jgi:hypothetical protein
MGMKIVKMIFTLFCICPVGAWADGLTPSEIEALRQEFEQLNKYQSPPTYSLPSNEATPLKSQPLKNTQFVDLDSVFDENTNTSKRKRN